MKNLGGLQTILELPRRQAPRRVPTYMEDSFLVGNLEELVNLSLQEIFQPLNQLGLDSTFFQSPIESPPQSPHRIMDGNAPQNANQPMNPPPLAWRARTPLNLDTMLHAFPHNVDK